MQQAVFSNYKETDEGSWFIVHVPGWFAPKQIIKKWMNGAIRFDDGRSISAKQRKLLYALFKDMHCSRIFVFIQGMKLKN